MKLFGERIQELSLMFFPLYKLEGLSNLGFVGNCGAGLLTLSLK
jgi:hypothetical protein